MKIVLDSNILYSDWLMDRAQMKMLERYLALTHAELCIPEVVVEETIRHFQRKYKDVQGNYEEAAEVFKIVEIQLPTVQNLEEATAKYRAKLMERLTALKARILPLPSTNLKALLMRDLEERKPFDSSGRGFRDALIWESILEECARNDEQIVVVTSDSDFGNTSSDKQGSLKLHQELMKDLERAGIRPDRVALRRGLRHFNEEFVLPLITRVYHAGEPTRGTFVEALQPETMLSGYTNAAMRDVRSNLPDLLPIRSISVGRVSFLRWPENARIIEAFDLGENNIQVLLRTSIVFNVELYIDDDEFNRLTEIAKSKSLILLDNTRDAGSSYIKSQARLSVIADFVFVWNTQENSAKGIDMVRFGFTEQELLVTRL